MDPAMQNLEEVLETQVSARLRLAVLEERVAQIIEEHGVKRMPLALFVFALLISAVMDFIGLLPFVGLLLTPFTLFFSLTLHVMGYKAGIARIIVMFAVNFIIEGFFSAWMPCSIFIISFYIFNNLLYAQQQRIVETRLNDLMSSVT